MTGNGVAPQARIGVRNTASFAAGGRARLLRVEAPLGGPRERCVVRRGRSSAPLPQSRRSAACLIAIAAANDAVLLTLDRRLTPAADTRRLVEVVVPS